MSRGPRRLTNSASAMVDDLTNNWIEYVVDNQKGIHSRADAIRLLLEKGIISYYNNDINHGNET
jgi:hypothetical protein